MATDTQPPRVSVCIPTFNGQEHLVACLASLKAQSFADWEAVICDDSSTDNTLKLAAEMVGGDRRFRISANPQRLGLVGNWNHSVSLARGQWIKFLFQDDVLHPNCLEKLLAACEAANVPFGFCERNFIFDSEVPVLRREYFVAHAERLRTEYSGMAVIDSRVAVRNALAESTFNFVGEPTVALIRRDRFSALGGFDAALIQLCDAEYWHRLMVAGAAAYVPEVLAEFRIHANATTSHNQIQRSFRKNVLDGVVLSYRFAFDANYTPLRKRSLGGRNAFLLKWQAARAAARARNLIAPGDAAAMADWRAVCAQCSGLDGLAWLGGLAERLSAFRARLRSPVTP